MTIQLLDKEARKILLHSQKLFEQGSGSKAKTPESIVQSLSYVQIDSISVIQRAHHHTLFSRLPGYERGQIYQSLNQPDGVFEYWSHAAALLPMQDFRFSLYPKQRLKLGPRLWFRQDDKVLKEVYSTVEKTGPLGSKDLKHKGRSPSGWWNWKPAKKALEQLFLQGDLMVVARKGIQKTWDITRRVLPEAEKMDVPTTEEYVEYLLDRALRSHGLVSRDEVLYLRPKALKKDLNRIIDRKLKHFEIREYSIQGHPKTYLGIAGQIDHSLSSRIPKQVLFLNPFDNILIQRERLWNFFGMRYQLECYVPRDKRQYGYFTLPILYSDRFIGRVDMKNHRKEKTLEVLSFHPEKNSPKICSAIMQSALQNFMNFQECKSLKLSCEFPCSS